MTCDVEGGAGGVRADGMVGADYVGQDGLGVMAVRGAPGVAAASGGGGGSIGLTAAADRAGMLRWPGSSGGGGGGGGDPCPADGTSVGLGGGGGGGGGVLVLTARVSLVINRGARVLANGGNGGNGAPDSASGGGGGGSGGLIVLRSATLRVGAMATVQAIGGRGGTGGMGTRVYGSPGGNGGWGRVVLSFNNRDATCSAIDASAFTPHRIRTDMCDSGALPPPGFVFLRRYP